MKNNLLNILKIFIPLLIIIIILFISIKSLGSDNSKEKLKSKTTDELVYLEHKLISIANKVNNISFGNYSIIESKIEDSLLESNSDNSKNEESSSSSEQNDSKKNSMNNNKVKYELKQDSILNNNLKRIDWDYIKVNSELLYQNLPQLILDLHSLNVKSEEILDFGNTLDTLILAVKNENKIETLKNISILFSYIPKYEEYYINDDKKINIDYSKYYILNSYCSLEENNWEKVKESIDLAKEYFSNIINNKNMDTNENIINKMNKIYILINELNNSINLKDKDIFYIKYKVLMKDLANL